ncbi:MAG: hypothetical protein Q8O55_00265, partial [Dehalococcoidales bacterium]|nr:hypothetical protein [Dehalococcoidales bacterium]
ANPGGPYVVDLDNPITLDGSGSSDPNAAAGDSIVTYHWSINGGVLILSGPTPVLTAAQINTLGVGVRPVSLTVTDEFGATGSASTTLSIYDNTPVAAFTASPNPAALPVRALPLMPVPPITTVPTAASSAMSGTSGTALRAVEYRQLMPMPLSAAIPLL